MRTIAMSVLLLSIGCAPDDPECAFYGYDLLSRLDDFFKLSFDNPAFNDIEFRDQTPVEVHSEQVCGGPAPNPTDLPRMTGRYLEGDETVFEVVLEAADWTDLRDDSDRGYGYYRAEVFPENLTPLE